VSATTEERAAHPGSLAAAGSPGVVVMGADYRGLGVVRSLGRRGFAVAVLRGGDDRLAALSRYADRTVPWPEGPEEDRVDDLVRLADGGLGGWTLFPTTDEDAALVARHHGRLAERFVVTTPAWETLRLAYDKRLTYALADGIGVPTPRTFFPRSAAEVEAVSGPFPVILKPAIKEGFNRLVAAKAWPAADRTELLARYEEACTLVDPGVLMVQEVIPGDGSAQLSLAALCHEGRPLAHVLARRTRQYPSDFGRFSTFVETVEDTAIVEPSLRLLEAMRFTGLVELEYKHDPRTGVDRLLDANPRVWGWHTLCGRAGVDFPYLAWRLANGLSIPIVRARPGVRWVRLSGDVMTAVRDVAAGRLSARAYLSSLRGPVEGAIFAWDDPLPGLLEMPLLFALAGRRLARGRGV
jgi:predicted ATP-grasp superfamily ATP-dependent carboligase